MGLYERVGVFHDLLQGVGADSYPSSVWYSHIPFQALSPMASGSADVAPRGSQEDVAKAAWTALRNATEAELPRHWGDWAQIRDLARLIEFVTELELLDIIRHHAESFRLYRGQNCSCDSRQPPWYVMAMPLACEKSQR